MKKRKVIAVPLEGKHFIFEDGFECQDQDREAIINFDLRNGSRKLAVKFLKEVTEFMELYMIQDKEQMTDIRNGHLMAQKKIVLAETDDEIMACKMFLQGLFKILEDPLAGYQE